MSRYLDAAKRIIAGKYKTDTDFVLDAETVADWVLDNAVEDDDNSEFDGCTIQGDTTDFLCTWTIGADSCDDVARAVVLASDELWEGEALCPKHWNACYSADECFDQRDAAS